MSRIFTFGCSFTNYIWPTWADIILYDNKGYNLGILGGGYDSILYRIMEADRVFKFTPDDTAIVILTTPIRWDLIFKKNNSLDWSTFGQVTTSFYSKYLNDLYTIDGLLFKSYYNMILIDDYLKKTKINYLLGSVNDPFINIENYFLDIKLENRTIDLINYVKKNVNIQLQDFYTFLYTNNKKKEWEIVKKFQDYNDYHPRPKQYLKWVNDILLKKIDFKLNITEEMLSPIENMIDSCTNYKDSEILYYKYPKFFNNEFGENVYLKEKEIKKYLL